VVRRGKSGTRRACEWPGGVTRHGLACHRRSWVSLEKLACGLMAVRALTFDVFGTLVDWRSGIAGAFRDSDLEGEPEELANEWRERTGPSNPLSRSSRLHTTPTPARRARARCLLPLIVLSNMTSNFECP
jgi:hypothetical protein